jgi:hypothetical protein
MIDNKTYFSKENNLKYMETTQYKAFKRCEASALADLNNEYVKEKSIPLLVGSYVDAYFEGTLDEFKLNNPEVFTKQDVLKSEYKHAEYIIKRIERDELFMLLMSGKKQVVKTGLIAGVPFKIKIDSLLDSKTCNQIVKLFPDEADKFGFCDGAIVDLKIMQNFEPIWDNEVGMKVSFIDAWGYDIQGAIYQKIEGNFLPFFVAAATKEKEPNITPFYIPQNVLDARLIEVEQSVQRYNDLKHGHGEPTRCEMCDYCRKTKKLTKIINYKEGDIEI